MAHSCPQKQLAGLISEIRSVQLNRYEEQGFSEELREQVLPLVRDITRRSLEALEELERHLEEVLSGTLHPSWLANAGMQDDGLESVRDLCFLAQVEIRPLLEQLGRAAPEAKEPKPREWGPLLWIERVQGALTNGLCAVEAELAKATGRPSRTLHINLLRKSLDARRMTVKFRRGLMQTQQDQPHDIEARLRSAGSGLVRLIGRDEFDSLHLSDRLLARDLRDRILAWTRNPGEESGDRLWEEVYAFAVLLSRLNGRSELIRHDLVVIQRLLPVLSASNLEAPPAAETLAELSQILGRDDGLDARIESGSPGGVILDRLLHVRDALTNGRELTSEISVELTTDAPQ